MSTIHIPRHYKDTSGRNQAEGYKAESNFQHICRSRGWTVRTATKMENCVKHIDFWVDTKQQLFSVDVKSPKRVARRDASGRVCSLQDKLHWIEWTNRGGGKGWVRGHAHFIGFGMLNGDYMMVNRSLLEQKVEKMISLNKTIVPKTQWECTNGVLWNRCGNLDEMTMLTTQDLKSIEGTWILKCCII